MNETFNRRDFLGTISAIFAGIGSALMLRKFRSAPPSTSDAPRVLDPPVEPLDNQIGRYFDEHPELDFLPSPSEPPVMLARPSREEDDLILFDEHGFWKDGIIERAGKPIFDEDEYDGFAQGSLTNEEYAAYQRWLRNDYPAETPFVGSSDDEGEEKVPSNSSTREILDRTTSSSEYRRQEVASNIRGEMESLAA